MKDKLIDLYADGVKASEFNLDYGIEIDGYTFNPSIFKKHGAKDYLEYSKDILSQCSDKPVSLEVIADDEDNMIKQAKKLGSLGDNVFVKIPIVFTDAKSTEKVIMKLVSENIKMNITAIFTLNQIQNILKSIKDTKTILSVFAGRIFDTGKDAFEIMKEINNIVHNESKCRTLWASPRMSYDYINAIKSKTDIITMQPNQIAKLSLFKKDLNQYSVETVKQFFDDANSSGFKL
tara:strand:- start:120 stop:821 length:702 start_codon:yes stop_codon:yes gene_type:complete